MTSPRNLLFFGTAWCQFVVGSVAATTNTTSISGCDENENFGPPFNSTGSVSFVTQGFNRNDGKPWYLSVGLKAKRDSGAAYPGTQTVTGYVSVPEGFAAGATKNSTRMCVYHLGQRNATASQDGSCNGVLDDACAKYIRSFQADSVHHEDECPLLSTDEACGSNIFQLAAPMTLESSNCSASADAALAGVPDAYSSQAVFDLTWPYGDTKVDSFTSFDAHARQPNPVLLAFGTRQDQGKDDVVMWDSKLLCVTPVNVTAGSRDPKSMAIEVRVSMIALLAMMAATLSGISIF